MSTKRKTIIFYLPLSMDSLTKDVVATNSIPNATGSASGNPISNSQQTNNGVYWDKKRMYINPETFVIDDSKLIKETQTKGGFMVQYWGEQLTKINMSGSTGSAGIEGINILRDIYRHEQLHLPKIIEERDRRLSQEAIDQAVNSYKNASNNGLGVAALEVADAILTGGAITNLAQGFASTIESISNIFESGSTDYTPAVSPSVPTLAAFATNVQMYHDGVFYRGYFTNFNVTESAEKPGIFTYQMNFMCTRKYGNRNNFMPWHRNPLDYSGATVPADNSGVSKGTYPSVNRLSIPLTPTESNQAFVQKDYNNIYKDENSNDFIGERDQKSSFSPSENDVLNKSSFRRKIITG